jgi:hypothetical protein
MTADGRADLVRSLAAFGTAAAQSGDGDGGEDAADLRSA